MTRYRVFCYALIVVVMLLSPLLYARSAGDDSLFSQHVIEYDGETQNAVDTVSTDWDSPSEKCDTEAESAAPGNDSSVGLRGMSVRERKSTLDSDTGVSYENSGETESSDWDIRVYLKASDKTVTLPLETYITGVVMAEMPVSFHREALKAQAIAARSYTLYRMKHHAVHTASSGETAAICTDPGCCQAYLSLSDAEASWGKETALDVYNAISSAVSETAGMVMTCQGEVICAAFHSSSAGSTSSAREAWGGEVSYLVSVDTPEDARVSEVRKSAVSVKTTLEGVGISLTGEPDGWMDGIIYGESGRVESVCFCGQTVTGGKIRTLFGLKSTDFKITFADGTFVFTVSGYGHGVGMSQYGADTMAQSGFLADEILTHYYSGVCLVPIDETMLCAAD